MLLRAAAGALALLALWTVLAAGVAGVGLAVRRGLGFPRRLTSAAMAEAFWLGFACVILFAQLWQLFAPAGSIALAIVGTAGALGLAWHAGAVGDLLRGARRSPERLVLGAVLLVGLWSAHQATATVANFDTYMYHIPVVEWYREYPLVPGLANLHGRFGFNNANFLLAALIESGPWSLDSTHVLNGVVLLGFLGHVAARLLGWIRGSSPAPPAVFDLVLLAPALAIANYAPMWAGLTPDVAASLGMFAAFSLLFAAAYRVPEDARDRSLALVTATALLASAAAIKLNVAMAAVPAWVIGMTLLWRLARREPGVSRGAVVLAVAIAAGIGLTWMARGAVASGYLLYPNTALSLPVDWKVPIEQARAEYDWIRLFGHYRGGPRKYNGHAWLEFVCAPTAWLGPWMRSTVEIVRLWTLPVPAFLAAAFGLLAFAPAARRQQLPSAWSLALPLVLGIALWWHVAPRLTFGLWAWWLLAALVIAQHAGAIPRRRSIAVLAAAGIGLVAALPLIGAGLEAARRLEGNNFAAAAGVIFVEPPPDGILQPTRWHYPLTRYSARGGLTLLVPQGHRCGRAELLCTSHPAKNLELRRDGDLRHGFRVRGDWRAERWPNPWARFLEDWRSTQTCTAPASPPARE